MVKSIYGGDDMKKILPFILVFLTGCSQSVVENFIEYPHDFSNVELTYKYHYDETGEQGLSIQKFYDTNHALVTSSFSGDDEVTEISYYIEEDGRVIQYYNASINDTTVWEMNVVSGIQLDIAENLVLNEENLKYIGGEEIEGKSYHVIEVLSLREVYEGPISNVNFYYYVDDNGRLEYIIIMRDDGKSLFYSEYAFTKYGEVMKIEVPAVFVENIIKYGK
jgi:hypothetical protein